MKDFIESLIDNSVDGMLAFDNDYRYTLWNSAMERLTGDHRSQTIGRNVFDVFPFLRETGEEKFI